MLPASLGAAPALGRAGALDYIRQYPLSVTQDRLSGRLRLQAVQVVGGAEDEALVVLQHGQPARNIGGVTSSTAPSMT